MNNGAGSPALLHKRAIETAYTEGYYSPNVPNPYSIGSQGARYYAWNAGQEDKCRGFVYEPLEIPLGRNN
jgi:hypothetical protein